jgi:hypothetical protein
MNKPLVQSYLDNPHQDKYTNTINQAQTNKNNSRIINIPLNTIQQILQTKPTIRTKTPIRNLPIPTIRRRGIPTHTPRKLRQSIGNTAIARVMPIPLTLEVQRARNAIVTRQCWELTFLNWSLAGDAGVAVGTDAFLDEAAGSEDLAERGGIGGDEVAVAAVLAG